MAPAYLRARSDEIAVPTFCGMLDLFPILRRYHRVKGGNLSGGEQQMLAIARALMAKPRLILLDEPSLGLAPQMIDTVFDLIAGLRRDGLTVLLVEQNVALALEIADRATVLANGEVVLAGAAKELAAPYRDAIVLSGVIAVLLLRPQGLIPAIRVQRS